MKNVGAKGISLVVYPKLTDDTGTEYAGKGIFLGAISPGGMAAGESTIPIGTENARMFKDHGMLTVRFQNVKPIPAEATGYIDFSKLT